MNNDGFCSIADYTRVKPCEKEAFGVIMQTMSL